MGIILENEFVNYFEDWTKLKISFKIESHLQADGRWKENNNNSIEKHQEFFLIMHLYSIIYKFLELINSD